MRVNHTNSSVDDTINTSADVEVLKDDHKREEDITETVVAAEKLMESFEILILFVINLFNRTKLSVDWLKMRIGFFIQYSKQNTRELQSFVDDLEVHGHTPNGLLRFLVSRSLLGYLNYGLLNEFSKDSSELKEKVEEYAEQHKKFLCNHLKNIITVFKHNPRLAPASVFGLPEIKVELHELWQGKSYCQWKEVMENIVEWPEHLLIKSIEFNCVVITYYIMPFILSRVVDDLNNETIIRRFRAKGAVFSISQEVRDIAKAESDWINLVVKKATVVKKIKLSGKSNIHHQVW